MQKIEITYTLHLDINICSDWYLKFEVYILGCPFLKLFKNILCMSTEKYVQYESSDFSFIWELRLNSLKESLSWISEELLQKT